MLTIWLWTAWNEARSNARICEHLQLVRLIPYKIVQILWWMEQIANANIFFKSTLRLYVLSIFQSTFAKLQKKLLRANNNQKNILMFARND